MASKETPAKKSKRKIIIRIKRKINNDNNNDTAAAPTESQILLDQQVMGLIRQQALEQIATADDSKHGTPEEQMSVVNAAHRYLWSFGFDGFELKRGWEELSRWRA